MSTSSPISVIVSTFHPFPSLCLALHEATPLASLPAILSPLLPLHSQSLSTGEGKSIGRNSGGTLGSLRVEDGCPEFLHFRLVPKVLGGKGGFGSQLRAAGGRMSSQKTQNNDSCRDLSGRRLSTIKEARKLASAIASEPERQATKRKEAEERLALLNQEVARLDALVNATSEDHVKKRRLDDSHLIAQSKESVEKVRSAVALALKKKKKQKLGEKSGSVSAAATNQPTELPADGKDPETTSSTNSQLPVAIAPA